MNYKKGYVVVPILLGVAAVGLTGAIVYDRVSGGKLSDSIRSYISDGFSGDNSMFSDNSYSNNTGGVRDSAPPIYGESLGTAHGSRSEAYERQTEDFSGDTTTSDEAVSSERRNTHYSNEYWDPFVRDSVGIMFGSMLSELGDFIDKQKSTRGVCEYFKDGVSNFIVFERGQTAYEDYHGGILPAAYPQMPPLSYFQVDKFVCIENGTNLLMAMPIPVSGISGTEYRTECYSGRIEDYGSLKSYNDSFPGAREELPVGVSPKFDAFVCAL
ncbi:MAG: hypothetical protein KBC22_02810 [Candidatus Pacebacteria bacterium]|nr:hypothetical protein [Candidatus Paceibacterota bacterium]